MSGQDKPKDGEGSKGTAIDHDSPYYLHPSDFPKQLHVNDVLTDSNYTDWSQEMTNFLFAKNKIDFVDGTIAKPESTASNYKLWMRCDAMIKGWLTTAMEKNIRDSVKYATTSAEIWSDLQERFGKESAPRGYELRQKIAGASQDGSTVSTYYTRLRSLWDEASQSFPRCSCNKCTCELGKKITQHLEKERLYEFLMGLDSDFAVIKTQILATKPTPTLGVAYHMVAEDERQRTISNENRAVPEQAAFKAFQKRESGYGQSKEKASGRQGKEVKENDHCTFCGRNGHKREGCFKIIGYPDWWLGKKEERTKPRAGCVETGASPIPGLTDDQYNSFVKFFSGSNIGEEVKPEANMAGKRDGSWIMDSGCTEYIAHESELVENPKGTSCEAPVVIPNGDAIPVEGRGESTLVGGVKIKGVLYVPKFKCNLLSVSRLSKELQCAVTFFPDFFVIQGLHTRSLIGAGECRGGLYYMKMAKGNRRAMMTTVDTWHKRSLFACKPIQAGDCILKVPFSVQLAPDNLHPSINSLLGEDVGNVVKLALVILLHQRLGQASEWAPYITCLPCIANMHSTIFWSDEELKMIQISSLYHETLKYKAQIEKDFSSIQHVLDQFPKYFEGVTLREFKHAYNIVESRAWVSTRGVSLIPFADFFNHDAYSETDVLNDDFKQVSEVIADENYAPGDEVLIRYGKFSNAKLLLDFGFIIPHNKYDRVKVEVNAPLDDHLHALKLDLLHRHKTPSLKDVNDLSSQENGFMVMEVKSSSGKGRGIPQSLRALARVLCCTSPQELQDLAMKATKSDGRLARIPLKNRDREVEAHQFLHSRFSHMIENYNAALESLSHHNSGKNTLRMQLARDFLTGELRILESAAAWLKNYCQTLKQR